MTKIALRAPSSETGPGPARETPADVLAHGWIGALQPLHPKFGEMAGDQGGALGRADHWTVETLLKLGYAAPDRAYEVGVRIVELSGDPWILKNVGICVFQDLLRRDRPYFTARLSADARRLPRLRHILAAAAGGPPCKPGD